MNDTEKNRKPYHVILLFLLGMCLLVYLLKLDKPVEADAQQGNVETETEIEKATVVKGSEIAPVQQEEVCAVQVREMTPEELEEERFYDSLELLSICVEAEAGNQGQEGKRLVADVIFNRVSDKSGSWPDTIEEVITQPGQFSSYWDGGMERVKEISEETYEAVRMELKGSSYPEIYYFREGAWSAYGTPWRKVGDHYFSKK